MPRAKKKNGDTPATQHDLSVLAGEMSMRFDRVDERMDSFEIRMDKSEQRMDRLEKGLAAILEVLSSIDIQLRELKTLPDRVRRLER
jgi:archaellum component FlaC